VLSVTVVTVLKGNNNLEVREFEEGVCVARQELQEGIIGLVPVSFGNCAARQCETAKWWSYFITDLPIDKNPEGEKTMRDVIAFHE